MLRQGIFTSSGVARILVFSFLLLSTAFCGAATYYFDANGPTTGSGVTNGGSYDASITGTTWSTSSAGTLITGQAADRNSLVFCAGNDASGLTYTVTGNLSQPGSLSIEEGSVLITAAFDFFWSPTIQTADGTSLDISGANARSTVTFNTIGSSQATLSSIANGSGTASGVNKNGTGLLVISNAASNVKGGLNVNINNGVLRIKNGNALACVGFPASLAVNSGGTLELANNITVANNTINLNGMGYNNLGALINYAGTNFYSNAITLGADARINSAAGLLTLNCVIPITNAAGGSYELTLGGAGNMTVSSSVEAGSLVKDGAGSLTLSATNNYAGETRIKAGQVALGAGALISSSTNVIIYTNAVLDASAITAGLSMLSGCQLGGSGTVTGKASLASGAMLSPGIDTNTVGTLTVSSNLTLAGSFVYNWKYDGTLKSNDCVNVGGNLVVPSVATVNVTRINADRMPECTIFRYSGTCTNSDFSGWVVNDIKGGLKVKNYQPDHRIVIGLESGLVITIH